LIDNRLPLLFYCHDALRFGQTARAALVAGLSSHFRVVVVGGEEASETVDGLVEVVCLRADAAPDARDARAQLLLGAYLELDPAVILIEQFPFGCPELSGEIVSVLEAAAANPRTRLVACCVMDILVDPRSTAVGRDDRTRRLADRYFDVVLVHADPRVGRLEDTFEPPAFRVPIRYTGFVAPEPARDPAPIVLQPHEVVVTCDSRRPDGALFRAAIEACDHWPPGESLPVRIIAGPAVPDRELAGLQAEAASRAGVVVQRSAPDVRAMASCGAVSVSDGACDTVFEMLRTGVPSLIVPDAAEDERGEWAHHLAALGVVRLLERERLTGAELADEIMATLRLPPPYLDLNRSGAAETLKLVTRLADPARVFAGHSSG
jgi:predicted glycosyltransferase